MSEIKVGDWVALKAPVQVGTITQIGMANAFGRGALRTPTTSRRLPAEAARYTTLPPRGKHD